MPRAPFVYDKAKYHEGSCVKMHIPREQSFVHTGLFVAWLAIHDLLSKKFEYDSSVIAAIKSRSAARTNLYEWCDGVLDDEMLSAEGNKFSRSYFDFDKGEYIKDYMRYVSKGMPSEFHVSNTWTSYDRWEPVIDARYRQFKGEEAELPPVPSAPLRPVDAIPFWKRIFARD